VARLSYERIRIATQFQLLGEDTQKAPKAKEDSTQLGTARTYKKVWAMSHVSY